MTKFANEKTDENIFYTNLINTNQEYKTYLLFNPQRNGLSLSQKVRTFDFSNLVQGDPEKEIITNLYKGVNVNNDVTTFNGKINFN